MTVTMSKAIADVKKEVHQVKEQVSELFDMKKQIQDLSQLPTQITEIRNALLGTEYNENNGIVKKVDNHEDRLKSLESASITSTMYFNVLRWLAVAIGTAVVTGIIGLLFLLFRSIGK